MGLFGDLLHAAGAAVQEAFTLHYNVSWNSEEDKAVFLKLIEKWKPFFSNLEISESINFEPTGQRVLCGSFARGQKRMLVYLYDDRRNYRFNFANDNMLEKADEFDDQRIYSTPFYYEFTKNNTKFVIHFFVIGNKGILELESSILENSVSATFLPSNCNSFYIDSMMREIGLPELGEKIKSVTSKLIETKEKRWKEQEQEEKAKKREEKEAEEKLRQEAEAKRIAEKKKETEAILSKLDEI